ncbi:MAG: hypothetical protein PHH73_00095 [Candidatus Rickettsiella isopodorum]|nr:hypothetical protein [Candidatus Rickettsiella isopodorum]
MADINDEIFNAYTKKEDITLPFSQGVPPSFSFDKIKAYIPKDLLGEFITRMENKEDIDLPYKSFPLSTNNQPEQLTTKLGETATISPESQKNLETISQQPQDRFTQLSKETIAKTQQGQEAIQGFGKRLITGIPKVTGEVIGGLGSMIAHPVKTWEDFSDLVVGAMRTELPKEAVLPETEIPKQFKGRTKISEDKYKALKQHFINKYGSPEKARESFIQDPASVMFDASVVLEPAGAGILKVGRIAKIPALAKAGAVASEVGTAINPLRITTGVVGKGLKVVSPVAKEVGKLGAKALGVPPETLAEVEKLGFRNVIQKKYTNKKIPVEIQARIENNITNLQDAVGKEYNNLTEPLKNIPVNFDEFRQDISDIVGKAKINPFKGTASSDLETVIINGIDKAQPKNYSDLLELRRNLDDVIFTAKGTGVKSKFADNVRTKFNDYLHKNPVLKEADSNWYNLETVLKEIGNKVTSDTGENFLKRFGKLTQKQKEQLVTLEKNIGGEPFIQDLTRFSLAGEFYPKTGFNIPEFLKAQAIRTGLKTGERVSAGTGKVGKFLEKTSKVGIPEQFRKK